jgi:hypothetical protein
MSADAKVKNRFCYVPLRINTRASHENRNKTYIRRSNTADSEHAIAATFDDKAEFPFGFVEYELNSTITVEATGDSLQRNTGCSEYHGLAPRIKLD